MPRSGRLGLYHYALRLPARADLGQFLLHLEAIGEPWAGSDHLFSEALYLTDPDGITVEVYADRARETWTRRGPDLISAIDPLDRGALVAAAADARWSGFPAGGDMGHLHFFVGDLSEAERFYVAGLGFEPSTRLLPGALFVAANGYHHHVGLNVWAAGSPIAGPGDAGLDEWALELHSREALAALVASARATGIEPEEREGATLATDPWGIRVRLTAR
jgi:catechol 2,3-dioxygenase